MSALHDPTANYIPSPSSVTQVTSPTGQAANGASTLHLRGATISGGGGGFVIALRSREMKLLGGVQATIGFLVISFQAALLGLGSPTSIVGHGIWSSFLFILAGFFGILAGVAKRGAGYIITCLILSILSAVATLPLFGLCAVEVAWFNQYATDYAMAGYDVNSMIGVNGVMIFLALVEELAAVFQAVICSKAVCCGKNSPMGTLRNVHVNAGSALTFQQIVTPTDPGFAYQVFDNQDRHEIREY